MGAERLDQVLKAAGDLTRLRLLNLLRFGNMCVSDFQTIMQIPQPTVSRHLAILRGAGLVHDSRKGTRIVYGLSEQSGPFMDALRDMLDKCCPHDENMWADFERYEAEVQAGNMRVES